MLKGFDYKKFAQYAKNQSEMFMPEDIKNSHKDDFLDKIYNFTYIAGEALSKDDNIKSPETARLITQLVSEWTFHKYIDLLRSDIPVQYHESLLQKLAFVAYEIGKEAAINDLSVDKVCNLVEVHLNREFKKACSSLFDKGYISQEVFEKTLALSNVDEMTNDEELVHNIKIPQKRRSTFNYTVIMLTAGIVAMLINMFLPCLKYEFIPEFLRIFDTFMIIILSVYLGMAVMYMKIKK